MTQPIETAWNVVSEREWRAFATAGDAALQQDWSYGAANMALGGRIARAAVFRGGALIGLSQFLLRDFGVAGVRALRLAIAFRGPVWGEDVTDAEKASAVRSIVRSRPWGRRAVMMFMPEAGGGAAAFAAARMRRVMTGQSTAMLDLTPEPDEMRRAQRQKWRNRLSAAERNEALRVAKGGVKRSQYQWLLAEEERQQKAKRYQTLPVDFTPAFAQASAAARGAGRQGIAVWRADVDGNRAAAMLFLRHGDVATYHIGWSSEAGRRANAHNLLLWRAALGLRAAGVRRLDLGRLSSDAGAGVARFKLGSGARPEILPGAYL